MKRKAWQGIQAAARGEGRSHGAAANDSGGAAIRTVNAAPGGKFVIQVTFVQGW